MKIYKMKTMTLIMPSQRLKRMFTSVKRLTRPVISVGINVNRTSASARPRITEMVITTVSSFIFNFSDKKRSNFDGSYSSAASPPTTSAESISVFVPTTSDSINDTTPLIKGSEKNLFFFAIDTAFFFITLISPFSSLFATATLPFEPSLSITPSITACPPIFF